MHILICKNNLILLKFNLMTFKEEIRNLIIENETKELQGLKQMYRTHLAASDLDEESSLSNEDFAQQDQSRDSARGLEIRINQAKAALDNFLNLSFEPKTIIEPGALVLTDSINFYIGISASLFEYKHKKFIGLDTNAPIYKALGGAKAGDEICFNEKTYKISEIL